MTSLFEKIQESKSFIEGLIPEKPSHLLVLGTGLGDYEKQLVDKIEINYASIPHFPTSTVQSHAGKLVFGYQNGHPIVVMAGRFHYYEGYSAQEVTFPIRVINALGVDKVVLSNAAGGINPHFKEGEIVLVLDHINMMPEHPLRGPNDDRLGLRFPDMMEAYNKQWILEFEKIGRKLNIPIKTGVYLGLQGPSLETPAEYRMAHILGADLVGMSTIPEVIIARHCGMKVCVFSIVSNVCFPKSVITETTVAEVIEVVGRSAQNLGRILDKYFESMID